MRTPRVVLLLALVVPLMGNDCRFAARVGGPPPPPPPPPGSGDPPPPTGGGGVIIVATGESASASDTGALRVDDPLVASVLAASVATVPDRPRPIVPAVATLASERSLPPVPMDPAPRTIASGSGFVTPEPSGLLLFLLGFGIVSHALGTERRRG